MPETDERKDRMDARRALDEVGENLPESAVGLDDGDVRPADARKPDATKR